MVKCPHISVCRIAIAVGRDRSDGVVTASQANITIGVGKRAKPNKSLTHGKTCERAHVCVAQQRI